LTARLGWQEGRASAGSCGVVVRVVVGKGGKAGSDGGLLTTSNRRLDEE
jgi:hypothetical protein